MRTASPIQSGTGFRVQRHPHRAVGVTGDDHVRAYPHRHRLRVLGIGGIDLPASPLHRPRHHRLEGVARLHRRQRFLAGRIRGFVVGRGVPEGAAAVQGRRGPHLQVAVGVEPRRRTGEDLRPVSSRRYHLRRLLVSCRKEGGAIPEGETPPQIRVGCQCLSCGLRFPTVPPPPSPSGESLGDRP